MPTEIRHIIFQQDEVVRAIIDYHRRTGNQLPTGTIIKTSFEKEPTVRCGLHIGVDADNSRQIVWIEEQILAAALIFFCIQNRIPLPTKSTKILQVMNDQVALKVTRTSADARGGPSAPSRKDRS